MGENKTEGRPKNRRFGVKFWLIRFLIVGICIAAIFLLLRRVMGIAPDRDWLSAKEAEQEREEVSKKRHRRFLFERTEHALSTWVYFQDAQARPPLCYVYYETSNFAGPALSVVPCKNVDHLLINKGARY